MIYILIPVIIFIADYFIKDKIENTREIGEDEEILGGKIILHKYHNKGAMLNFLDKKQEFVAGLSTGMTVGVLFAYLWLLGKKGMGFLKTGFALVLGGAASNIYDRIKRGYVVDYFSFQTKWKKFRQIVFNISDLCIFAGSFLFILWNLRNKS